jgi:hypothetical protein
MKDLKMTGNAAAALGWGVFFFACYQAALSFTLYHWQPQVRDPEYGLRLASLRKHVVQRPNQPLVVMLGSSRVALGVRPSALEAEPLPFGEEPIVFNFSLLGAGPVMQLLCLNRLLADGVRPDLVFIECWPPFWYQDGDYAEEKRFDVNRLAWRDLPLMSRYLSSPRLLYQKSCFAHAVPWFAHRFTLLSYYAPCWVPWSNRRDDGWSGLDQTGWLARNRAPSPSESRRAFEQSRSYFLPICENYRMAEVSDRALNELLSLCRREGIQAALLFLPEGKEFQGLYPPDMRVEIDAYMAHLGRTHSTPVIDTRNWMTDADFLDGFHLLPHAATAYTRRFARDVLQPLLYSSGIASGGQPPTSWLTECCYLYEKP